MTVTVAYGARSWASSILRHAWFLATFAAAPALAAAAGGPDHLIPAAADPAPAAKVPYLGERCQQLYRQYLSEPLPRAFAISRNGRCAMAAGTSPKDRTKPADPKLRALELCKGVGGTDCALYSVDEAIVFSPVATPPAPAVASPPPTPSAAPAPSLAAAQPEPPYAAPVAKSPIAPPRPLAWVLDATAERGLNDLYSIPYTENGSTQVQHWTIQANTGLGLMAGVSALPLAAGRLRTRAMAGFKFTAQSFSNGDVTYYAFPVEIIETLELGSIRLGGGLYALLGSTLTGDGAASSYTGHFDSTAGFTIRAEWVFNRRIGVGLRYVWNHLSGGASSMSAPAIGAVMSFNGSVDR